MLSAVLLKGKLLPLSFVASNRFNSRILLYLAPFILQTTAKKEKKNHDAATSMFYCGDIVFRVLYSQQFTYRQAFKCWCHLTSAPSSTSLLQGVDGFSLMVPEQMGALNKNKQKYFSIF